MVSLQILFSLIIADIMIYFFIFIAAMHAVIGRQKIHGMHFDVLAKTLHLFIGDRIHSSTVVGKLEGEHQVSAIC